MCGARDDNDEGTFEITVNPSEKTIAKGEDFTATVLVTGTTPELENVDGSMQATYDDTIVSVDDGTDTDDGMVYTITGVSAGTTTVDFEWTPDESIGYELETPPIVSCEVTVIDGTTPPAADTSEWQAAFNGFTGDWGGWQGSASEKGVLTHTCTVKDIMDANDMTSIDELGGISAQVWNAAVGNRVSYAIRIEAADGTIKDVRSGIYTVAEGSNGDADGTFKQYQTAATGGDFVFAPTDVLRIAIAAGETIPAIPAHTHTLTAHVAVDATCTAAGNSAYWTCSGCDKIFSDESGTTEITSIPTIPALGHKYGTDWKSDADSHWHECDCGDKIAAAAHTEDSGAVTKEPTETETGIRTYKCDVCGYEIRTEIIDKLPPSHEHSYGTDWKSDADSHWHECGCGDKIDSAAHTEDSGTVTKEPTETETGVRTYKCGVCGYTMRTETIDKLPPSHEHSYGTDWKSDADSHWHECDCGDKIDAAAHTEDSGTVTKAPTETETGIRTYKCGVCGYEIRTETIDKLPPSHEHSYGTDWKSDADSHWHECGCGDKIDSAAHTEDSGTVTKAPTETETGVRTYKCKVCGYVLDTEVIPATGGSDDTSKPDNTGKPDDTSKPDDIGNISKYTQVGENIPNTEIVTPTETLAEAALTPEERKSAKNGEEIKIVLKLEDGTAIVSDEDKAAVEAALNGSENLKLAQYLEINLYKIVGGIETGITQTNEPITIKIAVPEALALLLYHFGEKMSISAFEGLLRRQ